jgi:hypothetical protein
MVQKLTTAATSFEKRFELDASEVRGRFQWAKARGRPDWLWPDVSQRAWRQACELIARTASAVLCGAAQARIGGDILPLSLAAYTSGMGPLLGWWLEQGRIAADADVAALFELHLRQNELRDQRMRRALDLLLDDFDRASIDVAALKSAHTGAHYFPSPATRPASDIDLLVKPDGLAQARSLLAARGYRDANEHGWRPAGMATTPRSLLFVHADDPWSIDLHSCIEIQPSSGARPARLDPWPWLVRFRPTNERLLAMGQPMLLLYLAAHASGGLQNLTLLRLVELNVVIRADAATGKLDWQSFLDLGRRTGVAHLAWPALALTDALTPGLIPPVVLAEMKATVPRAVRRVIEGLRPATAQRLDRLSLREHFMWAGDVPGLLTQLAADFRLSALKRTLPSYGRRLRLRAFSR